MEALVSLFVPLMGEMEGDHGRCELGMASGALDEPGMHAGCKEMGGIGMPQGRESDAHCGDPSPVFCGAAGALDTAPTHGSGRGRALRVMPSGGGQEPGGVPMGCPGATEQCEGRGGQRDRAVLGALPTMDMDVQALTIEVRALEVRGFMEPQAQARDGGTGDVVVERG